MRIPFMPFLFTNTLIKPEIDALFQVFYESNRYILGEKLKQFETEYANYIRVRYAVGVGNGYDALSIALQALEIGPGDEVIIPAHTFIATGLAVINCGADIVFADVDEKTYTITNEHIHSRIHSVTKAIIPVHLYGNPCDMEDIMKTANEHSAYVIEDNAQAQGGAYQESKTGSIGHINITSFYPTKNLGAMGDGGMITTNDRHLALKARKIRNYGHDGNDAYELSGVNSRLDELQAAILLTKLKYLDAWNEERIKIAEKYITLLSGIPDIILPQKELSSKHVYYVFPIRCSDRDLLKNYLYKKEVETLIHYPEPLHLLPPFQKFGYSKGSFPISEEICETELSLPVYPGMTDEMIGYVCETIREFYM